MLEAVIALLGEQGVTGMSVDAVAQRAGVSKATIYRHWPTKTALCGEAIACVVVETPRCGYEDPRAALVDLLTGVGTALERSDAGRLLPHLASAAATDPRLAAIWRASLVEPVRVRVAGLLRRAAESGALAPDTDIDLATELLLAPLFHRRLVTGAPAASRSLAADLVAAVWRAWAPGQTGTDSGGDVTPRRRQPPPRRR